jgi:threonine/homoserine/homoserine lactone efflux protein
VLAVTPGPGIFYVLARRLHGGRRAGVLLAFIPQFIEPARPVFPQFVLLGTISVTLNTTADLLVAHFAGPLSSRLRESERLRRHTRVVSGGGLIALGAYVALADERR